jgi:hypothetical protein
VVSANAPAVHLIVFSKDRPLQLHGMLTSVFRHWRGECRVSVVFRDDEPFVGAYEAVWAEFDTRATFRPESDFAADLVALVDSNQPLTCFGCDDVVYVAPVHVPTVVRLFSRPDLLGVSLRLGRHVTRDMFGRAMPQPPFVQEGPYDAAETSERWPYWRVDDGASGDWAYPWEVLGTVYPTAFVRRMVATLPFSNPSLLEHHGSLAWRLHAEGRSLMCAYPRTRLVVPTVNLVQSEFGNGIVGPAGLEPAFLLDCWNRGLRLDTQRYQGVTPDSWRVGDFFLKRDA